MKTKKIEVEVINTEGMTEEQLTKARVELTMEMMLQMLEISSTELKDDASKFENFAKTILNMVELEKAAPVKENKIKTMDEVKQEQLMRQNTGHLDG